jgi:transposase-like protein
MIDHSTLNRWVLHFAPLLEQKSRKFKRPVHRSWRMDETYIKIKGKWRYLYRAVDKYGATIDFLLTKKRDVNAAKTFFRKTLMGNRLPVSVTIDKSGANNAALEHFANNRFTGERRFKIRQVKYINNILEQDHRHIKRITNPMGCFRKMHTAKRTIAGIELMNMIKKNQLNFTKYIDQNLTPAEQFYRLATV